MKWKTEVDIYLLLVGILLLGSLVLTLYMTLSLYPIHMIIPPVLCSLIYVCIWNFLYRIKGSKG